jgi:molecular chaperone DnaK (HSP70)
MFLKDINVCLLTDTVFDAKRLIGREFSDSSVQQDIKHFPFKVIEKNSKPIIEINTGKEEKHFAPEEISAMVLGKMREIAVSYFFFFFISNYLLYFIGSLSR